MSINKEFIKVNCTNKNCSEFLNCDMLPTEVIRHNQSTNIDLLLFGIGSGKVETKQKLPFVGPAGKYLRSIIKHLWDTKGLFNIALTNNIRFHPMDINGKDREPIFDEISRCKIHLEHDINHLKPKVIVPLGRCATNTFIDFKDLSIGKIRGTIYNITINNINYSYIPTYHPSFLLRTYGKFNSIQNNPFDKKFIEDINTALNI